MFKRKKKTKPGERKGSILIFASSKALGDRLFISWIPKVLKRQHGWKKVHFGTWKDNRCIMENNPFIDKFVDFAPYAEWDVGELLAKFEKEYDKVLDLRFTLETNYLWIDTDKMPPLQERRDISKDVNYYDYLGETHDLRNPDRKGQVYFTNKEKDYIKKARADAKERGVARVLWQMEGTGRNKIMVTFPKYINWLASAYKNVEHWVGGVCGNPLSPLDQSDNIKDARGLWPDRRQAMVEIAGFDLIIGPESFFVNLGATLGIPTVCFYSHSAPENLTKFCKNANWVLPKCECSPCYVIMRDFRGIYLLDDRRRARNCEIECVARVKNENPYRVYGYKCTTYLVEEEAIDTIRKVLNGLV